MSTNRGAWFGAAAATAFVAVTGGTLLLAAGWAVLWTGEGIAEALGLMPAGWRVANSEFLVWAGGLVAVPGTLWLLARFFAAALDAERAVDANQT